MKTDHLTSALEEIEGANACLLGIRVPHIQGRIARALDHQRAAVKAILEAKKEVGQ